MNPLISRRRFLRSSALVAGSVAFTRSIDAASLPLGESVAIDTRAEVFMQEFDIPGFSIAFAHRGHLAYAAAYGFADAAKKTPVTIHHRFRIASVSKPFTSVAIYTMVEQGKLKLSDPVFGPNGILARFALPASGSDWLKLIEVRHLLTHTCGGWGNDRSDPMFMWTNLNQEELIATALMTQPLQHAPGTHFAYSNFGYCLLGRIIEAKSGKAYRDYVQEHVLTPCGIRTMSIGGKTSGPGEVTYFGPGKPYSLSPERMDSHGGWIATPTDLVSFAVHVDGFADPPDILQPASIQDMVAPTAANPNYAKGWFVNPLNKWWHGGGMDGTTSILVRTASGMCWAATANCSRWDVNLGGSLDDLMWAMARGVTEWQA